MAYNNNSYPSRYQSQPPMRNQYGSYNSGNRNGGYLSNQGYNYNSGSDPRRPMNTKYKPHEGLDVTNVDWTKKVLKNIVRGQHIQNANALTQTIDQIKLLRSTHSVSIEGSTPLKPTYSFDEASLPVKIREVVRKLGWTLPTPIQAEAMPLAMSGVDVVGIAQTGSGKTAAFVLPAINHIANQNVSHIVGPLVVAVVPTRELAIQVHEVAKHFCRELNITCVCVYGGAKKDAQRSELLNGANMIIATPGRLLDFISMGVVIMDNVSFCILDEADRMLDMGFEPQIKKIMRQIRPDRQMLMFSATWPKEVKILAETFLKNYIKVNVGSQELAANHNIKQIIKVIDESQKEKTLYELLCKIVNEPNKKTIIFFETKRKTDTITFLLRKQGWPVAAIHGNKDQRERERVLGEFKSGRLPILLATDVAARGLDVSDISFVINYDYPNSSEDYVHRIGRTGRAGNSGTAYTFFTFKHDYRSGELINVLREAKQEVPQDLVALNYHFASKKNGSKFNTLPIKMLLRHSNKLKIRKGQKRTRTNDNDFDADKRYKSSYGTNSRFNGNSHGYQNESYQRTDKPFNTRY
ncbi:hypothetical protein A3Q56_03415 [Intoshia linei]|uniref:RNA helicase n=1 Tax=Intoshia linei TaxID=1819745 RepID=A0A177B5D7_9BILA|nr:hypothetical protein A3Q56_03415 [Intoshia linei]